MTMYTWHYNSVLIRKYFMELLRKNVLWFQTYTVFWKGSASIPGCDYSVLWESDYRV